MQFMHLTANIFVDQGGYEAAEKMYRRLLKDCEMVFGKNSPPTLKAVADLSSCLRTEGKYNEAEEMIQRALEGFEASTEKLPAVKIWGAFNQGYLHFLKGKFEIAEELIRQAAEISEKTHGKEHPITLDIVHVLASVLVERGKYKVAEEIYCTILRTTEIRLGKTHPDTLSILGNLGNALESQGEYEGAEKMHRSVLEAEEKIFGKSHPSIFLSCNNLGMSLSSLGRYAEAEVLFKRALSGKEKVFGENHPFTLNTCENLGSALFHQQNYKPAEEMHARALKGFEKQLGKSHPRTLSCMFNVAGTLMVQRKYRAAKEMLIQVLKGKEEALGKAHPETQICVEQLNSLFRGLAMTETAEWGLRDLGREWEEVLGPYGVHAELPGTSSVNNNSTTEIESWLGASAPKGFKNISNEVKTSQVDLRGSISKSIDHLFDQMGPAALLTHNFPSPEDDVGCYVASHVDEQLMLFIPFHRKVKVHSIHITSVPPPNDSNESLVRPTSIRLFKNTRNILDFEEAEELSDTQQFKIAETSWDKETSTTVLNLNFVKFQDVFSLVIFVNGLSTEDEMENGVFTRLDKIRIFGK